MGVVLLQDCLCHCPVQASLPHHCRHQEQQDCTIGQYFLRLARSIWYSSMFYKSSLCGWHAVFVVAHTVVVARSIVAAIFVVARSSIGVDIVNMSENSGGGWTKQGWWGKGWGGGGGGG